LELVFASVEKNLEPVRALKQAELNQLAHG
jgi:hypothetical protein